MTQKLLLTHFQIELLRKYKPENWDAEKFDEWLKQVAELVEYPDETVRGTIQNGVFIRQPGKYPWKGAPSI